MSEILLEMIDITKTFPGGVRALDAVRFNLHQGEIHGLMGENGAGKSTFIKIITGVYQPDGGEIIFKGRPIRFPTPRDAQRHGVAAIYQHVICYPDMTVTENIFMGHEKLRKITRRIDWPLMHSEAQALLDQLDAGFRSQTRMGDISVARQQIVEIAKALSSSIGKRRTTGASYCAPKKLYGPESEIAAN